MTFMKPRTSPFDTDKSKLNNQAKNINVAAIIVGKYYEFTLFHNYC